MLNVLQTSEGTVFTPPSVQPSETNGQSLEPRGARIPPSRFYLSPAQTSIHARHKPEREHVLNSLDQSEFGPIGKQRQRILMCAFCPLFVATADGKVAVAPGLCRQRLCPTCQARRARETTLRVQAITTVMNAPRFVTLTLKSSTQSLKHQLDRLYDAFRALRRREFWKAHVFAGIAVAEVTRNRDTGAWHPHLHVIVDGTYMPQSALSDEWHTVTGDSSIVDIRAVHDRRTAAKYVACYVAKPAALLTLPPAAVIEFAYAVHGRRMLVAFGSAHRIRVPENGCETRPALAEPLASSAALHNARSRGCIVADHAFQLLARAGFAHRQAAGISVPRNQPRPEPLADFEWEWLIEALRYVAADAASPSVDECPFADAATIAASPPRSRPEVPTLPAGTRTHLRVDQSAE